MGVVIMWWVWIECRGVVSGCSYHEVYIILIIIIDFVIVVTYAYTPLVLAHFCSSIPTSLFILKVFFCLYIFYEKNE